MLIKLWFHLWLTGTESFHLNESIISLESYVKATAKKYRKVPSFIIKVLYLKVLFQNNPTVRLLL